MNAVVVNDISLLSSNAKTDFVLAGKLIFKSFLFILIIKPMRSLSNLLQTKKVCGDLIDSELFRSSIASHQKSEFSGRASLSLANQ